MAKKILLVKYRYFNMLFAALILIISSGWYPQRVNQIAETRKIDKVTYTILHQGDSFADFVTERPSKDDTSIILCIPAAFTELKEFGIDGIYVNDGVIGNRNSINRTLGGGVSINNGTFSIWPTKKGKLLTDSTLLVLEETGQDLFQQIQIVVDGKAESFKDQKKFQRRALVIFDDGKSAVIESDKAITLAHFSQDLASMNVLNAAYTDMGAWDEGWYRDTTGHINTIGKSRMRTKKQSNWVVFKSQ